MKIVQHYYLVSFISGGLIGQYGVMFIVSFFFSSRRRHTRSDRDWSSDVCSSDLTHTTGPPTIWRQTSFVVHRSPSLQACPTSGVKTQPPARGSQESRVQTLPSSHTSGEFAHCPVFGSHRSTVHGFPSSQARGVPWQVAVRPRGSGTHRSPPGHGPPRSHGAPRAGR